MLAPSFSHKRGCLFSLTNNLTSLLEAASCRLLFTNILASFSHECVPESSSQECDDDDEDDEY
eukprot:1002659-Pleurochrysis_carterae.AAC.1